MQVTRNPTPRLFGRLHHLGRFSGAVSFGHEVCFTATGAARLDGQQGKVGIGTENKVGILGLCDRHCINAIISAKGQEKEIPQLMQASGEAGSKGDYGKVKNVSGSTGKAPKRSPSGSVLLASSSRFNSVGKVTHGGQGADHGQLGRSGEGGTGTMRGTLMVDQLPERLEWKLDHPFNRGGGRLFRCFGLRVRRLPRLKRETLPEGGPRALDGRRATMEHKQERVSSSRKNGISVSQMGKVKEVRLETLYRQRSDASLHQQDGRAFSSSTRGGKQGATTVRTKGSQVDGGARSRSTQQSRRHTLEVTQGQIRLAAKQRSIQFTGSLVGTTYGRLVCNKKQQPTTSIRVVDSGLEKYVHRRSQEPTQEGERVRQPTLRHYRYGAAETASDKKFAHFGGTGMAISTLVADDIGTNGRSAHRTTSASRPFHPFGNAWSQVQSLPTSMGSNRISIIRQLYKEKKISEEVSEIITSRWSESTIKNYQSIWRQWVEFARRTKGDPIHPTISNVLQFLMFRFRTNQTAASVNHAIATLSTVLDISMGEQFMHSQHVSYFRKACNMKKPTGPALTGIWDIKVIFNWMRTGGGLRTWSRRQLLERLIVVLRLDLFARSSDLTKIYREQIVWEEDFLKLRFLKPKEWRSEGKNAFKEWSPWIMVEKLANEPELCSFSLVKRWMELTDKVVPNVFVEGEWRRPLFFKWSRGVAKPMSLEEISKATSNILKKAGVPAKYTPQSLRSAASSAALDDGASMDRVLAQGRWSSKQLFNKYYYRPTGRIRKPSNLNMFEKLRI